MTKPLLVEYSKEELDSRMKFDQSTTYYDVYTQQPEDLEHNLESLKPYLIFNWIKAANETIVAHRGYPEYDFQQQFSDLRDIDGLAKFIIATMGNPYTEKLNAEQYQKLIMLRRPLVFVFSDNENITAQFKEYVFGKLNISTDGINFAVAGSEQEDVVKFVREKSKKNDVLAVCQLVRDSDECVVVSYDLEKPLEE